MTPNKKLLREALEKIAVCMPGSIMSRIATDALAATEQPVTSALVAVFEGYVDDKPRIAWTGAPLPAGAELYAAPITEQPARQDTAYAELRVRIERARKVCMDVDIHPDALENILADRDRLTERVAVLEAALNQARNMAHEEAAELLDSINDPAGDCAAYDNREMHCCETERMQAITMCAEKIRALAVAAPHPHADEAAKVEWMPIETAPKDTAVLLYCGSYYDIGHFNTALERWVDCTNHHPVKPTRWHPLPAPPSPAEGE